MNMHRKDVLKGRSIVSKNIFDTANQAIDEIKRNNPLVEYFQRRGVVLTKSGSEYKGLCPFHDDHNPSLSVNDDKGVFKCFGCGKAGTIIDAVALYDNISTGDAIKLLQKTLPQSRSTDGITPYIAGKNDNIRQSDDRVAIEGTGSVANGGGSVDVNSANIAVSISMHDNLPSPSSRRGAGGEVEVNLNTIADYYHKRLYESKTNAGNDPITYLRRRGIKNSEMIARFKIGFADGTIADKLSDGQKQALAKIGIFSESGREHFRNCITVPIFDDNDIVVGMYGRNIADNAKFPHLYLKGDKQDALVPSADRRSEKRSAKHRGVFNRKASKVYDEIILTESIIDALSLIELGIQNVQPIYGVNGFTAEHLRILHDDRVKTIVIAFDNDDAGTKASDDLRTKLVDDGFAVKTIAPPHTADGLVVKDWNEYLITAGTSVPRNTLADTVKRLIESAEPFKTTSQDKFTAEKNQLGYTFTTAELVYRVSGVKELFLTNLRVNIKAELIDTDQKYYDNLDLYSSRSRSSFATNLAKEFYIEPKRIEKDLIKILEHLEAERDRALMAGTKNGEIELTDEEKRLGMELLRDPNIFDRIVRDMETLGYVGEDLNKILIYLSASSRKLDDPISVIIISESASGKSMLVDTVKKLMPEDEVIAVTSLSDQALNYIGDLRHKFLILGEAVHGDIIEHQIREMLSAHELSRLVTMKDPKTGAMETRMMKTEAIVASVMTTTNPRINPENASRCFLIHADESRDQTARIHTRQREKHSLRYHQTKRDLVPSVIAAHIAAQRMLRKIAVINPLAVHIKFPDTLMRTRRDHDRFLDLIACVAYLRQYQKELRCDDGVEYIECDIDDYRIAYDMLRSALAPSLMDIPDNVIAFYEEFRSLARQTAQRKALEAHEVSLTQRELREHTGFNHTFVKRALRVLIDYEYVQGNGGARKKGHYRLRSDEPIGELNLSMIPNPEDMARLLNQREGR